MVTKMKNKNRKVKKKWQELRVQLLLVKNIKK